MSGKSMLCPTKRSSADDFTTIEKALRQFKTREGHRRYGGGFDSVLLAENALAALSRLKGRLEPKQPSLF